MNLHFFASIETINGIQEGYEMFVFTNNNKPDDAIHVSFDIKKYAITKDENTSLFKSKKEMMNEEKL